MIENQKASCELGSLMTTNIINSARMIGMYIMLRGCSANFAATASVLRLPLIRIWSVSYTHLDVYKRQSQN